jgi:hypothetical protein
MTFDDWKDAVDRALHGSGSSFRCALFDPQAVMASFSSGVSPVIAARQFSASPQLPVAAGQPQAQQVTVILPEPWIAASPRWMRVIGAVIVSAAVVSVLPCALLLVITILVTLGMSNSFMAGVAVIGLVPVLYAFVGCAFMAGFGQIVLVMAEVVERVRRP